MLKKVIANPIKNDRKDEYLRMGAWPMLDGTRPSQSRIRYDRLIHLAVPLMHWPAGTLTRT